MANTVQWLGRQARRGLADLPRNVRWALDVGVKNPVAGAGDSLKAAGDKAVTKLADANPFSDGGGTRLDRVDAAMERAHELESVAHDEAQAAKEQADAAASVEEEGRRDVDQARKDGEREVARVEADARREADEYVAAIRRRAEEIAAEQVAETQADADARLDQARKRAERARAQAEQAIERAREQMSHARELAEEAAVAARDAADEARARAERLAGEADEEAEAARRRADEVAGRKDEVAAEGRKLGADADTGPLDLDDLTKQQLLDLATEMGLELKGSLRKAEVAAAIRRHSGGRRGRSS